MLDDSRKDKCEPTDGELFSGGYALVTGGPMDFVGKMVFLIMQDSFGFWECADREGDMLILDPAHLMPVSMKDWDNKTELDTFLYEARFGV